MEKEEWEVSLPRKLTPDELSSLKDQIRPLIDQEAGEEYVSDVLEYACSMVNNLKSINYVVKELIEMEFDFLPTSSVEKIAEQIQVYMASVAGGSDAGSSDNNNNNNSSSSHNDNNKDTAEQDEQNVKSRLVSIKSNAQNALTMSGALGASREGGRNKQQQSNSTPKQERHKNEKGKNRPIDNKRGGDGGDRGKKQNNQSRTNLDDRRADNNSTGRRDRQGRAFDRLTEGRGGEQEGRRGPVSRRGSHGDHEGPREGRGGPRGDGIGGRRDGPRGGRGGDDRHGGRDGGRGGGRGGGGRGDGDRRVSGQRRDRDEFQEESGFVPAHDPRGGAGRGRFDGRVVGPRGGRGGGRGFDPNKRQRVDTSEGYYDEYYESYEGGYDESYDYYPPYRGGPSRGRGRWGGRSRGRGGRGGGRFSGRGRGGGDFESPGGWDNSQEGGGEEGDGGNDQGAEAAAAAGHPSPIVQASYGGGYRGRGYRGRGRGRSFPGRTHVKNILASKTWVRKKDGEEGGEGEQGGQSSDPHQDGGES